MGDKLNGDGLWASRMMLPEHKEAILRKNKEPLQRSKPTLDSQQFEEMERTLGESYHAHSSVKLQLFDPYENIKVCGIVTDVRPYRREIKLQLPDGEWRWISLESIVSADL
ncbi:YolD-like protein [compost metagenome]